MMNKQIKLGGITKRMHPKVLSGIRKPPGCSSSSSSSRRNLIKAANSMSIETLYATLSISTRLHVIQRNKISRHFSSRNADSSHHITHASKSATLKHKIIMVPRIIPLVGVSKRLRFANTLGIIPRSAIPMSWSVLNEYQKRDVSTTTTTTTIIQ